MSLGNINSSPQYSDKNQSRQTAEFQLKFIRDNWKAFCSVATKKDITAVIDFEKMVHEKEPFIGNQTSYIDSLYEKCWKGIDEGRTKQFGSYSGMKYGKHVRLI